MSNKVTTTHTTHQVKGYTLFSCAYTNTYVRTYTHTYVRMRSTPYVANEHASRSLMVHRPVLTSCCILFLLILHCYLSCDYSVENADSRHLLTRRIRTYVEHLRTSIPIQYSHTSSHMGQGEPPLSGTVRISSSSASTCIGCS